MYMYVLRVLCVWCVYVDVCVRGWVCVGVCLGMCVRVGVRGCVCVCVFVCACMFTRACMCCAYCVLCVVDTVDFSFVRIRMRVSIGWVSSVLRC